MKHSKKLFAAILMAATVTGAMAQPAPAPTAKPAPGAHIGGPAGAPPGLKVTPGGPPGGPGMHGPRDFKPVTRAEAIKRATDQFDRMDRNKDGTVTGDEIEAMQKEMRAKFEAQQAKAGAAGAVKPGAPETKPAKPAAPVPAKPGSAPAVTPASAK